MSKSPKYLLVSLPQNIALGNDHDEALNALSSTVSADYGITYNFPVPTFKIGTLDALVQQADDLTKLSNDCEGVVAKITDILDSVLEGDQEKIKQQRVVDDKPVEIYLQHWSWNRVKYRTDKPISELVDSLRKELAGTDNDVKSKNNQYNTTKNNLLAAQRKQVGNLSTKSLASIVNPKLLIQDSEYIETHLIAVPNQQVKDYLKTYETLSEMVVPRSSMEIDRDSEFTLFAVSTFKKTSADFVHKCREKRWTPRDFRYKEGGKEEEQKEIEKLQAEERKLWGETLRLSRSGYSEAVMSWMHAMALRVFVESVLRYGLPAEFVCGLIRTTHKLAKKAQHSLDMEYSHLGGNAFARDKKGRILKDDAATHEMQGMGHGDSEYTPYVFFEFELS